MVTPFLCDHDRNHNENGKQHMYTTDERQRTRRASEPARGYHKGFDPGRRALTAFLTRGKENSSKLERSRSYLP